MKIAFFDIDGTMVNVPNGLMKSTDETFRVLSEFKKQGNYIVVATARGSVPDTIKDIDFNGYETKEYNVKVLMKENDDINEYLDYEFTTYA